MIYFYTAIVLKHGGVKKTGAIKWDDFEGIQSLDQYEELEDMIKKECANRNGYWCRSDDWTIKSLNRL